MHEHLEEAKVKSWTNFARHWSFLTAHSLMHFIHRFTWKSSQYYI